MTLKETKNHLKLTRWTQSEVAKLLGISESYLSRVLRGHLKSKRLLDAIGKLPPNPNPRGPNYAAIESLVAAL